MLSDSVHVARRFQKSIHIESDHSEFNSLDGFVCPKSSTDVLISLARHVSKTGHCAFTWTGPYGCGKSSLVLALSALLSGDKKRVEKAKESIGQKTASIILNNLPPKLNGWTTIPVVGRRSNASQMIGEALSNYPLPKKIRRRKWSDDKVVSTLVEISNHQPENNGGVILFIDEMGKFLEAAANEETDVYIFQLLAEAASRSQGRLIIVGILHQAFNEYAHRIAREMREEWSKIQGRFVDLPLNVAGEEHIEIISKAIVNEKKISRRNRSFKVVASEIRKHRPGTSYTLEELLAKCWPLHPVVTCLLGPVSKRSFGQNQRSVFSFLTSAEPDGFQDFINNSYKNKIYEPDRLWNYLRINLESSILASPDGHRWAMATDAIERCEALGGDNIHLSLIKSIALIDLFKERSGLLPTINVLSICVNRYTKKKIHQAINQIKQWSLVVFRKHSNSFAIFAGSDFDMEQALDQTLPQIREIDFTTLNRLTDLRPILAKKHYHETGTLRWFDITLVPLNKITDYVQNFKPKTGEIGAFIVAIPTEGETIKEASKICERAILQENEWITVIGLSDCAWKVSNVARELLALNEIQEINPNLAGDLVAQSELQARITVLQGEVEFEIWQSLRNATWLGIKQKLNRQNYAELSIIASKLANKKYPNSPKISNELINRIKPSVSAIAAQNTLLRAMITNEGKPRLGIEGYSAASGLFVSLLEKTKLYRKTGEKYQFSTPSRNNSAKLYKLWQAMKKYLRNNEERTISINELYHIWSKPPFGVKKGLLPILIVAFILSNRDKVALYRDKIFQSHFKDIDVEVLARNPQDIQLRWMDLSSTSQLLLSSMAEVVRKIDTSNELKNLEPLDVARGLIAIYDRLHPWTKRTSQLSTNGIKVREMFKHANDPNKFLFDDIPTAFGNQSSLEGSLELANIVKNVRRGLNELVKLYPSMLQRLLDLLLSELQVPNSSSQVLAELRDRAININQLGGDFRLNAFINRISTFYGSEDNIESIASLAANKPPRNWTDLDVDRAKVELTDFSQQFIRVENFARVKGRQDKRHAIAVVVGLNGKPEPNFTEFEVTDGERKSVNEIIAQLEKVIDKDNKQDQRLVLAALAEVSSNYINYLAKC